ncbi:MULTISPECIES: NAD(P)H-binding protein [Streptomyces]|uniref:Nucleotide-diphosphate-sugar epimerase n=1 Tax=Streptomyces canarius TaxID=285453 RepID=A0ABQ3CJ97_9ACTN|nr:NAD(P)H-binding protein [Streptomyces canarius]GHA14311.1 nucleotide-diphosphate-sugar epimerase [Streptomyces canarius]
MTVTAAASRHVVLTGATGQIASLMVTHLAPRHRLTLTSRTPRPTGQRSGVRHVTCDYGDVDGLVDAFRGADAVFVVTNDPTRPEHDRNILRAADRASVGHIVKLSAAAVRDAAAHDLITEWQRTNEDRIKSSGIPWTMIQPRSFMSHALAWASSIRGSGTTYALHPHSRNACIAPEDVAEVSARVLGDSRHHFQSYEVTGPQSLSAHEQSAVLAEVLGRPLTCRELSREEAHATYTRRYPPVMADALLASAERQRAGAKAFTTDTVGRLTGRPATTFAQWATGHKDRFE